MTGYVYVKTHHLSADLHAFTVGVQKAFVLTNSPFFHRAPVQELNIKVMN